MESILKSIKKLLGISEEETHFDTDIIMHINSVFSILGQMGVGPAKSFHIEGDTETWDNFIEDDADFNDVKTYVYLKVRMLFDPPVNSSVLSSMERMISEYEWRLHVAAMDKKMEGKNEDEEK